MKHMLIVAALAALSSGASAQAPAGTPADTEVREVQPRADVSKAAPNPFQPGQALAPMARATIFVRDLETSLKLYRDILGLKPMFDNYWKGKGINAIMGTEGLDLHATVLMAGTSVVGNIGLYQLHNEKSAPPPPPRGTDTRTGDVAVIFPTNDIWGLTRKIEAAGYEIISPPVTLITRPGMKQQPLEMMFRDADGVLVNLVQAGVPE
ncbi:MAG: VOC family protein [Rhodospirillaceae bacterium]|nr:VOC family protein [Rhodospirillaceae bacterium]